MTPEQQKSLQFHLDAILEMRLNARPNNLISGTVSEEQVEVLSSWSNLNIVFEKNFFDGDSDIPSTVYLKESDRICLVSVHGITHFSGSNDNDYKMADLNTGGLVRLLQSKLHTSSIVNYNKLDAINPWKGWTKANYAVMDFLSCSPAGIILDLHGCKDNNDFDLALGTHIDPPNKMQKKLIDLIVEISNKYKIRIATNPIRYQSKSRHSITGRAINDFPNSPALQVEISRSFRFPQQKNLQSALLVELMCDIISQVHES